MSAVLCALIVLSLAGIAPAAFIETVPVGNPGNAPDMRHFTFGLGEVGHSYRIGKYEVTNGQYVKFLNAVAAEDTYGLYNDLMSSDSWAGITRSGLPGSYTYDVKSPAVGQAYDGNDYVYDNKPVVFVSWGDVVRYANWLHNGRPTGAQDASTTEDGAYTLNGAVTDETLIAVTRNPSARWWIPSEDEWYKAAYYDEALEIYHDFPTGADYPNVPNNNVPSNDTGNSANFLDPDYATGNQSYPLTDVGAYVLSASLFGTFDQGGNIFEWIETPIFPGFIARGLRGGSIAWEGFFLEASQWYYARPTDDLGDSGFRVATIVPEPGSIMLCLAAAWVSVLCRYRERLESLPNIFSNRHVT
jgi:formylglycine-generating enzyme required for sulfatase activity